MRITKLLPFLLFLLFIVFSCKNESENDIVENDTTKGNQVENADKSLNLKADFFLELPENAKCGDQLKLALNSDEKIVPDSIVFFVNQKRYSKIEKFNKIIDVETLNFRVGKHNLTIKVFKGDKNKVFNKKVKLLSDIKPKQKTYKIVNRYHHDLNAYTQGLCIDNGVLYEATGLETKSSLRRVDLKTGEIEYSIILKNNYFGEGITVFKGKIYQVTWRDHKGFVYEKDEFRVIAEFNYTTEGWGLTNDDKYLYMSDGTNKIHIFDPNSLSFIDEIEVFDYSM
ncbi:MAG: glutaminyl-peptide cyclotransferase, partial [Bacteroidota bacterium]|nr:glutaminyl-peptide cyclotransferase [Bacteroidota bacterium]